MLPACSKGPSGYPDSAPDSPYDYGFYAPFDVEGLVTVKRSPDDVVYLQYKDFKLLPTEPTLCGLGRAMASLTVYPQSQGNYYLCRVEWIEPLDTGLFETGGAKAQGDGLDILVAGYTSLEDAYLVLQYKTWWGETPLHHDFYLTTGSDPENPYVLELRQDSHGDPHDYQDEGLICFDLNSLPDTAGEAKTVILNWIKLDGTAGTLSFEFKTRE